jgi:NADH-quinone oxidoreductase subunit C
VNPQDLAARLRLRFSDVVEARSEVTVVVERGELLEALAFLRDQPELAFGFLTSVAPTDWPGRSPRYWVAYELASLEHRHRVRVKVGVPENDAVVPSVVSLYPTANWHEREAWDFYGVVFDGHPDLRRILLPEDWEIFPLRKTEELGGVGTPYRGAFIPPVDQRVM